MSVFFLFLDVSKAFDKISHWTFFMKLIDRHVPLYLVVILCYWYKKPRADRKMGPLYFNVTMVFVRVELYPCNFLMYILMV